MTSSFWRAAETHRRGNALSRSRSTAGDRIGDLHGKRRSPPRRGDDGPPEPGIDTFGYATILREMAAAAIEYELPPALHLVAATVETRLAEAERAADTGRHDEAIQLLDELRLDARLEPALALRHCLALAWAEMYRGDLVRATELLGHADALVRSPHFDAADRAEVLYRHGCVALKRAEAAEATSLFTRALQTTEWSSYSSPLLSAHIHEWRSRCHQLQRDWDAGRRDAERSLELAVQAGDERAEAHALFQASLVAERQRQWLLARFYAEQALEIYQRHGDALATARILNNIGGIHFLLGDAAAAEESLEAAALTADAAGSEPDVAQAISSLAQVCLRTGRPAEARERGERAAAILAGRPDFLDELGNAELVVAGAHAAEGDAASAGAWLD